ncbi:XRE family transcriptional regulator [Ectobacillus sp. JY-23]|uniref:helix-turn-helix domain-containing protein n=1 Tax=Ectobacillus sp. JY-23 TaxID=2933872 RepID=UPI001FF43A85|nr:XRE family transcriptional regulator [Ectobacillus sp. JY-23]UOY92445.1 XRE family transcriptional regulator [Ectobacillus sp. JY-23]
MYTIHITVGQNVKRLRAQRGWSLDKTAEMTGVSKGMLHQIERGETQPTVTTLWKIATGLHVSFSSLLQEDHGSVSVVQRKSAPDITEDNGNCLVYVLFPFDPQTQIEIFTIILKAGSSYRSTPHNEGVHEHITVTSGTFQIRIDDQAYTLEAGEAIRFAGNVPHSYHNAGDDEAVIQVVMHYGDV